MTAQPTITRTEATLGAFVTDVDLANLDEAAWRTVEDAFHEHAVLIFPGQDLSSEAQIAFASRFGEIEILSADKPIVAISNQREDGTLLGQGEHGLGDVEPQDVAAGPDRRGQLERGAAAAAADVEHALAGLQRQGRLRRRADRRQRAVALLLRADPRLAALAVPVGPLLGRDLLDGRHGNLFQTCQALLLLRP